MNRRTFAAKVLGLFAVGVGSAKVGWPDGHGLIGAEEYSIVVLDKNAVMQGGTGYFPVSDILAKADEYLSSPDVLHKGYQIIIRRRYDKSRENAVVKTAKLELENTGVKWTIPADKLLGKSKETV